MYYNIVCMWNAGILCSSTQESPRKLCVLHKIILTLFARLFILPNHIVKQISIYPSGVTEPNFSHPVKNEQ